MQKKEIFLPPKGIFLYCITRKNGWYNSSQTGQRSALVWETECTWNSVQSIGLFVQKSERTLENSFVLMFCHWHFLRCYNVKDNVQWLTAVYFCCWQLRGSFNNFVVLCQGDFGFVSLDRIYLHSIPMNRMRTPQL